MTDEKRNFRHESLQDADSIQAIIKALGKGFAKGRLTFSDEDGEIALEPKGLMHLKMAASKEDGRHRLTLRLSWEDDERPKKRHLKVK